MLLNRTNFQLLVLVVLLIIPGLVVAQDEPLTGQERIKLEQIRESLIQQGFLQQSVQTVDPEAQ
ncbi:hypothetical protein, partial [Rhodohalobacter sulfatireducens]